MGNETRRGIRGGLVSVLGALAGVPSVSVFFPLVLFCT